MRQDDLVDTIVAMEPASEPAMISQLVFAAIRLQVLQEVKYAQSAMKRVVKGGKWAALGKSIFCGYHEKATHDNSARHDHPCVMKAGRNRPRSYNLRKESSEDEEEEEGPNEVVTPDGQIQAFRSPPSRK